MFPPADTPALGREEWEVLFALELIRDQSADLSQVLASLAHCGVQRFNPVRFGFIESMARRALEQRGPVDRIVEQRAVQALCNYQTDFFQARDEAESTLSRVVSQHPDAAQSVRGLFESCDFKGVHHLAATLQQQAEHTNCGTVDGQAPSTLGALTERIRQGRAVAVSASSSFDDVLRQQELQTLAPVTRLPEEDEQPLPVIGGNPHVGEEPGELTSVRQFRESWLKLNADKLVTHAIQQRPDNPGPLNPQMLVIRSLATMRDLSPDYLNQFVAHIDTLLWLEKADPSSRPATARNKTRRRSNATE